MFNRRQFLHTGVASTVGAMLASWPAKTLADGEDDHRIEEDWEIEVASPDILKNSPELVTSMGPTADDDKPVAALLINHRTFPSYAPGGLQLQVWKNGLLLGYDNFTDLRQLELSDEIISFTFVMELKDSRLTFRVTNGSSETFGAFNELAVSVSTGFEDLDRYRPDDSVARSTVNVGTNRLSRYVLKSVRYFSGDNVLRRTDENERTVI